MSSCPRTRAIMAAVLVTAATSTCIGDAVALRAIDWYDIGGLEFAVLDQG